MGDEQDGGSAPGKVTEAIEATTGLVKAVPIYQDAIQPAARQVGKALETVGRAVNAALVPIKGLVWSVERLEQFFQRDVTEQLADVPPDEIATPPANIAVPTMMALHHSGEIGELRAMYARLLAAAMDKKTQPTAHAAFADIIRQLMPDEALVLSLFTRRIQIPVVDIRAVEDGGHKYRTIAQSLSLVGEEAACVHPDRAPTYLTNLSRLGLISIPEGQSLAGEEHYSELEASDHVREAYEAVEEIEGSHPVPERLFTILTPFGAEFLSVCVMDHAELRQVVTRAPTPSPPPAPLAP